MKVLLSILACLLPVTAQPVPHERIVESIVPWLDYSSACWSSVKLQNLGNRDVTAEIEAHRSSGALVPLAAHPGIEVHLGAGEHAEYQLQLTEAATGTWVRVRERIPAPQLSPVLAVSGDTECVDADELHTTVRDVAWPLRNPWFSGDVNPGDDGILALINTSERPTRVSGCYSAGVLYSVPNDDQPSGDLMPVCSESIDELVPPFGSRQFPVTHGANSHFSLTAWGEAIVLQMMRPVGAHVKAYKVDSTITFQQADSR